MNFFSRYKVLIVLILFIGVGLTAYFIFRQDRNSEFKESLEKFSKKAYKSEFSITKEFIKFKNEITLSEELRNDEKKILLNQLEIYYLESSSMFIENKLLEIKQNNALSDSEKKDRLDSLLKMFKNEFMNTGREEDIRIVKILDNLTNDIKILRFDIAWQGRFKEIKNEIEPYVNQKILEIWDVIETPKLDSFNFEIYKFIDSSVTSRADNVREIEYKINVKAHFQRTNLWKNHEKKTWGPHDLHVGCTQDSTGKLIIQLE